MKLKLFGTLLLMVCGLAEVHADDGPTTGYDRGFFIQSADELYRLAIRSRVQTRLTFQSLDIGNDREREVALNVPRARLTLAGHVLDPGLDFFFQAGFEQGFVTLKDYYLDYELIDDLHVRAGQWKVPFTRQRITSTSQMQIMERDITDSYFGVDRDIGVVFHNDYTQSPELEWVVGVFNGNGISPSLSGVVDDEGAITSGGFSNVPDHLGPAFLLRLGYNLGDVGGYREHDMSDGPFRMGVAANLWTELDTEYHENASMRAELDFIVKAEGFASTGGAYLLTTQSGEGFADQQFEAFGFYVQTGYLIAEVVEPALRYALIRPDGEPDDRQELGGGVNVFLIGNGLKWQTDFAALSHETSASTSWDYRLRSQVQLTF